MKLLNIVILAAGKGTRMFSEKPKVLHALAGRPLLQHVLDSASLLEPQQICVIYGYGGDAVPAAMKTYPAKFVLQQPQLGTGHAVQQAMPQLQDDSDTLVLYGDVPLIQSQTLQRMRQAGSGLVLLTVNLENPTGYGRIVRNQQGEVTSIIEEKDASAAQREITEINTGILLAPTALLRAWLARLQNNNSQGEYYLTDIVAMAVQEGVPVDSLQPENVWEIQGVNSKAQLAILERTWQQVEANRLLAQGVALADPARIDIRGSLHCGQDVEIDVGCIFSGKVQLGNNVQVGAYCIIKDAYIAEGCKIEPYSLIDSSTLGADCKIGPYARLRPGSKLHQQVHIGNFVEIKNSEIAENSKANHLSYIGDCSIGSRVNVGAGMITCNYDGVNKYRTIIEDDVFIGSDTQLVAPVTIGKGTTIGAGSTITQNTPPDQLSLSRSKQVSIPGWKRPVKG